MNFGVLTATMARAFHCGSRAFRCKNRPPRPVIAPKQFRLFRTARAPVDLLAGAFPEGGHGDTHGARNKIRTRRILVSKW